MRNNDLEKSRGNFVFLRPNAYIEINYLFYIKERLAHPQTVVGLKHITML